MPKVFLENSLSTNDRPLKVRQARNTVLQGSALGFIAVAAPSIMIAVGGTPGLWTPPWFLVAVESLGESLEASIGWTIPVSIALIAIAVTIVAFIGRRPPTPAERFRRESMKDLAHVSVVISVASSTIAIVGSFPLMMAIVRLIELGADWDGSQPAPRGVLALATTTMALGVNAFFAMLLLTFAEGLAREIHGWGIDDETALQAHTEQLEATWVLGQEKLARVQSIEARWNRPARWLSKEVPSATSRRPERGSHSTQPTLRADKSSDNRRRLPAGTVAAYRRVGLVLVTVTLVTAVAALIPWPFALAIEPQRVLPITLLVAIQYLMVATGSAAWWSVALPYRDTTRPFRGVRPFRVLVAMLVLAFMMWFVPLFLVLTFLAHQDGLSDERLSLLVFVLTFLAVATAAAIWPVRFSMATVILLDEKKTAERLIDQSALRLRDLQVNAEEQKHDDDSSWKISFGRFELPIVVRGSRRWRSDGSSPARSR